VVTEYGVADIYGKSDGEVIAALIEIADSRFQGDLMDQAKTAGKLPSDYQIPATARRNLPDTLSNWLATHQDLLPDYPFGTDFTEIEQVLIPALETLREQSAKFSGYLSLARAAMLSDPHPKEQTAMQRMGFDPTPKSLLGLALRGALRMTAALD